jgi:hypothetical protein
MSQNAENQTELLRPAQALSEATGETFSRAFLIAIKEGLARIGDVRKAKAEELVQIGNRCAASLKAAPADHDSVLYDARG